MFMFTDFIDEGQSKILIQQLANDFIKSKFNSEIVSDVGLYFNVEAHLKKEKLKLSLAKGLVEELLKNNQSKLNYSIYNI